MFAIEFVQILQNKQDAHRAKARCELVAYTNLAMAKGSIKLHPPRFVVVTSQVDSTLVIWSL